MQPIRVLVVDDSPLVRRTVRSLIEIDSSLAVVGTAANGEEALAQTARLQPDVVTLDLHMPVMDGLACLRQLVRRHRQRVVVLSTLATTGSLYTFEALALGAVDFVTKPGSGSYLGALGDLGRELRAKIHIAANVPALKIGSRPLSSRQPREATSCVRQADAIAGRVPPPLAGVVGIGGSTGGTIALESVLHGIDANLPIAVVAVQHIPRGFTAPFARYLDRLVPFAVKEAEDGEAVRPFTVYVAPGGVHLRLRRVARGSVLAVDSSTPAQHGFRPSVSLFLYSLAITEGRRAAGVLLSGIGDDGVDGLTAIKRLGGRTLVQDEESSIVFDMGRRAVSAGAVHEVGTPSCIADSLLRMFRLPEPSYRHAPSTSSAVPVRWGPNPRTCTARTT